VHRDFAAANWAGDLIDLRGYSAVDVTDFTALQTHMSQLAPMC
jgi:hypothetical protein